MPRVGADRLAQWARNFGLGSQIGLNIPGEASGLIPSKTWYDSLKPGTLDYELYKQKDHPNWSIGDTYNMAIGQGDSLTTPLQMVNVAATIANGGTVYRPNLLYSIDGRVVPRKGVLPRRRTIEPFVPTIIRRNFIAQDNLALIQEGMHESVDLPGYDGTSYEVRDPRIDAAGKTGTAEALGGPDAWWVGYAPFQHPKIAVVVLIPHAYSEGATASAPIAHKIFEDYFHYPAKKDWAQTDVSKFLVPGSTTTRAG
jgi:penicillin-binding protein 2